MAKTVQIWYYPEFPAAASPPAVVAAVATVLDACPLPQLVPMLLLLLLPRAVAVAVVVVLLLLMASPLWQSRTSLLHAQHLR